MRADPASYRFFLGGADLEMATIRTLVLHTLGPAAVVDKGLGWGARVSDYAIELAALPAGTVPVVVELILDRPLPPTAVVIDHHGERAGADAPTALEQVFALLGLLPSAWTRALALVAAHDRGHVPALEALGASPAEIAAIRAADRAAQGITAAEEETGAKAAAAARTMLGGRLAVVCLPHTRTAIVTDRLAGDSRDLLILSPGEVNFFGSGAAVRALDAAFPGGWRGGALPKTGFWGHAAPLPAEADLLDVLTRA